MSSRSDRPLGIGTERAILALPSLALVVAAMFGHAGARELQAAPAPVANGMAASPSELDVLRWAIAPHRETRLLRVCADPNNMPFTNRAGEGFENKIAELVAGEMNATLQYT